MSKPIIVCFKNAEIPTTNTNIQDAVRSLLCTYCTLDWKYNVEENENEESEGGGRLAVEARFKELYGGGSDDVRVEGSGDELVVFVRERELDGGWRLSPSGNFITLFTHALDYSVDFPLVQYRNRHDVGLVLKTRETDKLLCAHVPVELVAAVLDDSENWQPTEFATVRQVHMMVKTQDKDADRV